MKRNAIGIVVLLLPIFFGCVHKYAVPGSTSGVRVIPPNSIVHVATPPNGRDHRPHTYENSGDWTSSAVVQALTGRGVRASVGALAKDRSAALEAARLTPAEFVIFPQIVHWSDRATEWSGIPDRITLRVVVSEVPSGDVLDDREIRASSRWATFGGDHPQELLPELANQWAESICR